LKSKNGWLKDGNGTDDLGFSALPGGYRYSDGSIKTAGTEGRWWTAPVVGGYYAFNPLMYYTNDRVDESNNETGDWYSVRCVKE